ncbi:MAG: Phosphoglycerate kinase [Microgenomates group bacterium GW2011_GWB1_45_17]|nr:MAG: Phosphoglycerate kinase [Microgenomates group bacterium GW2011_GWB1_45_17]KKU24606.1 MAG: Phosphoglycerate kinase [Microgenomates group bacterium GW2011_GWC1_46_15]
MFRTVQSANVQGKAVLVRMDLDLPKRGRGYDETRLDNGLESLHWLLKQDAKTVTVVGHLGRPGGKRIFAFSLKKIEKLLRSKFTKDENKKIKVLENLRFDSGEEKNSVLFAKKLAKGQDLFVNDAFASSHEEHASIVGVPRLLPSYLGFQFQKELEGLEKAVHEPKRPLVAILGGAKLSTKMHLLKPLEEKVDVLLVGGKMATELVQHPVENRKLIVGQLTKDGKDISPPTIEQFIRFIQMAQTVVWNGPLGKYEDKAYRRGTYAIAQFLSHSRAYTIAGGGDTEAALTAFNMKKGIKFISSGGGAMLEYIAFGTLPGIKAVEASPKR